MFHNINALKMKESMQHVSDKVLLDVRTDWEFENGHIPNAININIQSPDFVARLNELDKAKEYYVYCLSGARSASACSTMGSLGFNKLNNLVGGISAWDGEIVVGSTT